MVSAETLKINITTVIAIVIASFTLYFFLGDLIESAKKEAMVYAITLDIERDQGVIDMYQFRIQNNVASPNDPARMATLKDKVARRMQERSELQ